jgi:thymidine kinase
VAKLYFYYSAMNAGKSTTLLQSSFNYEERGMQTMIFTAAIDDRHGVGNVRSRIGIERKAHIFDNDTDIFEEVRAEREARGMHCVLIDEAQFLNRAHVMQLGRICDEFGIPVLCYGLRTDFQANLFEGSKYLLALADELLELKTICDCGRKATMNLRVREDGIAVKEGEQKEIGGNDLYVALCRKHFMERLAE